MVTSQESHPWRDQQPDVPPDVFATLKVREYLRPAWNRYLDPGSFDDSAANIVTATAPGGRIGYMLVTAETISDDARGTAMPVATVHELERAFDRLSATRALIVDMRVNFGGNDDVGLMLAGLLTP